MNNTFNTLEFDHILRQLEELACTKSAKERIRSLEPYLYEGDVRKSQKDTTEARLIIESAGMPPIASMGYVDESTAKPAGFAPDTAAKVAEKLGLSLEIIDTTEENLLNSLDADLYDCVISTVGITEWNKEHYSATKAYADVSSVQDKLGEKAEYTKLAVFGKKGSCLIPAIQNQALSPVIQDGTLSEISKKYLEKDIIIKK